MESDSAKRANSSSQIRCCRCNGPRLPRNISFVTVQASSKREKPPAGYFFPMIVIASPSKPIKQRLRSTALYPVIVTFPDPHSTVIGDPNQAFIDNGEPQPFIKRLHGTTSSTWSQNSGMAGFTSIQLICGMNLRKQNFGWFRGEPKFFMQNKVGCEGLQRTEFVDRDIPNRAYTSCLNSQIGQIVR